MTKLVERIEQIGEGFDTFKQANDNRIDHLSDRLETMEAGLDRPKGSTGDSKYDNEAREHKDRFKAWIRDPHGHAQKTALAEAEGELSKKAVTIGTSSAGGYAVPAIIADEIEARVNTQNPWRRLVKTVTVGSSSYSHLVSKNAAGYGWVGEGDSRSETDTSDLIQCAPTFGTIYAYPKASEESMQDIFFDVGAWLVDEIADGFSAGEATAIWSGNGSNKPSGLINTTPESTADGSSPERTATALQYLPLTATSSPFTANYFSVNDLIDIAYSPKDQYLMGDGVAWVMRRATASHVRKLRDSNGQYLWQPSSIVGQPDTLLGYPIYMSDAMPVIAANAFPVAFGNFKRAYLFAVLNDIRVTVDDNISTPGQVKFYARRRVGGQVLNHEAVRVLKMALS